MVAEAYVPDLGELVWLSVPAAPASAWSGPRADAAGRHAALVLSPRLYNQASGLAVVCPVTSEIKGYPFEVRLSRGAPVAGAVLADHLRTLDWRAHNAALCGRVSADVLDRVQEHLPLLLGL